MKRALGVGMMVGVMMLVAGSAWGAQQERVQGASGQLVAVTVDQKTLLVEEQVGTAIIAAEMMERTSTIVIDSKLKGQPWTIGAVVTNKTKFGGKAKSLADLKPGDKVTLRWVRHPHGDVARSITVR